MKTLKIALLLILALALVSPVLAQNQPRKKRIAILDFEYGTVRSWVMSAFNADVDVGKGIADLIVKRLVQDGTYTLVERKMLDKILAEQNFSTSDRANAATAAQIGKILGVDAIVVGSITQFGGESKRTTVGGATGGAIGGILGAFGKKTDKAIVSIDARVVDTDTAEIVTVAEGKGESKREGKGLIGAGVGSGGFGAAGFDMSSSNFLETILGEAVKAAVEQLSANLIASNEKLKARTNVVQGLIAHVGDQQVVLNIGAKAGLRVGDQLSVERVTSEIKDPATGQIIRRLTDKLGIIEILELDDVSAVAKIVSGSGFQVGDFVKTITQ